MSKDLKCINCAFFQYYLRKYPDLYTIHCKRGNKILDLQSRTDKACKYFISKIFKIIKP